jgi:hypothetical protein
MFDKFMLSTLNAHMLAYFLCLLNSFAIALWFCVCKILINGRNWTCVLLEVSSLSLIVLGCAQVNFASDLIFPRPLVAISVMKDLSDERYLQP